MKVALIVLQLRVAPEATEEGMRAGVERPFRVGEHFNDWPSGCAFYFIGSRTGRDSKVKRVRIIDIPEGT